MCLASRLVGPICLAVHVRVLSLCRPSRLDSRFMPPAHLVTAFGLVLLDPRLPAANCLRNCTQKVTAQTSLLGPCFQMLGSVLEFSFVCFTDCKRHTMKPHRKLIQQKKSLSQLSRYQCQQAFWSKCLYWNLGKCIVISFWCGRTSHFFHFWSDSSAHVHWFSIHTDGLLFILLMTSDIYVVSYRITPLCAAFTDQRKRQ